MGVGIGDALTIEPFQFPAVTQQVVCVIDAVAALQQHRAAVGFPDVLRRGFHIRFRLDGHSGQHLRLRNIGCSQGCQRQQDLLQRDHRVRLNQAGAGGRHHHRVYHDVFRLIMAQPVGNGFNQRGAGYHTDLHRVRADVRKDHVDLLSEKFRSHLQNSCYAGGVLCCQCGDRAHGVYAIHGHRFQISLDTGASAAVTASDR